CHIFLGRLPRTNIQEATDIARLAGARNLTVGVARPLRQCPSVIEARRLVQAGAIGPTRLVTATITRPVHANSQQVGDDGTGMKPDASHGVLEEAGDDLVDILLWTTGQVAYKAAAFQTTLQPGIDLVTAAAIALADGTPVTLATSGISSETR